MICLLFSETGVLRFLWLLGKSLGDALDRVLAGSEVIGATPIQDRLYKRTDTPRRFGLAQPAAATEWPD